MSQIKLSEIRRFHSIYAPSTMSEVFLYDNNAYLLDLVKRLEASLEVSVASIETEMSCVEDKNTEFVRFWEKWLEEARELLKEIEQ